MRRELSVLGRLVAAFGALSAVPLGYQAVMLIWPSQQFLAVWIGTVVAVATLEWAGCAIWGRWDWQYD